MIIVISPAKTLDLSEYDHKRFDFSEPIFKNEIDELVSVLKTKDIKSIMKLMNISEKLATLNYDRYHEFKQEFSVNNSKPSILAFKGDVYQSIDIEHYNPEDFKFSQKHLRILSGLYGLIRPMDLLQAYRLEMSTKLITNKGKDLYQFWGDKITDHLNDLLEKEKSLINLASNEYFSVINLKKLKAKVINIVFKDYKNGKYKIIGILAKRARGMMVDFIIKNKIQNHEKLKLFKESGYRFDQDVSDQNNFVFLRK